MTIDVLHVVGARPNFPKLAPVFAGVEALGMRQYVVHTGQHFDRDLSAVLFEQLGLPAEDENLGVGAGTHAQQTAAVMARFEPVMLRERPKLVAVYGDVNSTVAATLVATKLGTSVAHVEAGLRSGDRSMPEELNRIVTDALCDLALTTSEDADANLIHEGRDRSSIHFVGNPMIDSLRAVEPGLQYSPYASRFGQGEYAVVTMHRPSNVDTDQRRTQVIEALLECADRLPVVFPMHPRRRREFESSMLGHHPNVELTGPMSYMEFLSAVRHAAVVVTDSGGVQEETTVFGVPCLTLRPNTERPVTITHGTNRLVTLQSLVADFYRAASKTRDAVTRIPPLWDGKAGHRIARVLMSHAAERGGN